MPQKNPFSYITGLSYGPSLGETSPATNYGPRGNPLGTYDVAASPDIRALHPYGSTFNYNGNTYTVNDASYAYGKPTTNTLEFRDTANNQRINPADIQWNNPTFFRFDQTPSSSPFEWYPKEGGMLGKIASRLPGASTYLAGQTVFDFIKGLFNRNASPAATPGSSAPQIPDNLQPTSPGYSFAPGGGSPGTGADLTAADRAFLGLPPLQQNAGHPNAPFSPGPSYGGIDPFGRFDPNMIHSLANPDNQFFGGLINWNGPGQANPTGREPGLFENAGPQWLANHPIGSAWWNLGAGGRGKGAAGIMPGRQQ